MHVPLERAPYYCTLCFFRCAHRHELDTHCETYKKHLQIAKEMSEGDNSQFLHHSSDPYLLCMGQDWDELGEEESSILWKPCRTERGCDRSLNPKTLSSEEICVLKRERPDTDGAVDLSISEGVLDLSVQTSTEVEADIAVFTDNNNFESLNILPSLQDTYLDSICETPQRSSASQMQTKEIRRPAIPPPGPPNVTHQRPPIMPAT